MDRIRTTMMRAWVRLSPAAARQRADPPRAGRARDPGVPVPATEAEALGKPGFAEEALPWLDAVHRFAQRLARDPAEAEDLVQETYLRAYRAWEGFAPGTNCRAWLFTICRNTHLHVRERASARRELSESDMRGDDALGSPGPRQALAAGSPDDFFEQIVDDALLQSIDALPEDFRETLILSDLGDLSYAEIAEVLAVPVGTVKSRLFRARRQLRDALVARGIDSAGAVTRSAPDGRAS